MRLAEDLVLRTRIGRFLEDEDNGFGSIKKRLYDAGERVADRHRFAGDR
ncbi:hypothetical protein CCP2SC5_1160007 [Azospirillaceae bacterium]